MENQEEKDAIKEQFRLLNRRIDSLFAFIFLATMIIFMLFSLARASVSIWLWIVAGLVFVAFIVLSLINSGIFKNVEDTQASQEKKDNSEK